MDGASRLRGRIKELMTSRSLTDVDRAEIRGLSRDLIAAGVLTEDESSAIIQEFGAAFHTSGSQSLDLRTGTDMSAGRRLDVLRAARSQHPIYRDSMEVTTSGPTSTPIRVIPLQHVPTGEPSDLTLVSLEVWSTGVAVRVAYPSNMASPLERLNKHQRWTGIDDTSTRYRQVGSYSSDAHGPLVETRVFQPAPSDDATTLTVHTDLGGSAASVQMPLR